MNIYFIDRGEQKNRENHFCSQFSCHTYIGIMCCGTLGVYNKYTYIIQIHTFVCKIMSNDFLRWCWWGKIENFLLLFLFSGISQSQIGCVPFLLPHVTDIIRALSILLSLHLIRQFMWRCYAWMSPHKAASNAPFLQRR
jgi:hypothetical protein